MPATQQTTSTAGTHEITRGVTIRVAGRGLFVVMEDHHETFRGTFEQCYDYVTSAHSGATR